MTTVTRLGRAAMPLTALLVLSLQPFCALGACKLVKVAELSVAIPGAPVVEVALNGHPALMLLDTGASVSLILKSAIETYQLQRVNARGDQGCGVGGCADTELVSVRDFTLGDAVVHDLRFLAVPSTFGDSRVAGVFGQDFLAQMDVEFDLPGGHLRLFRPQDCSGDQVAYWANAFNMVKLRNDPTPNRKLWLPVTLNGHQLLGILDSGASHSIIMTRVTQRPDLGPETPPESIGEGGGFGTQKLSASRARFAALTIGQETIQHPMLEIADLFAADREVHTGSLIKQSDFEEPDILIGADFIRMHRIYVANSQGKLYFTYQPAAPAGAPTAATATPSPPQNAAR
jgi:hypothetical protein